MATAIPTNTKISPMAKPEKRRRWCRCGTANVKSAMTAVLMAIHSVSLMFWFIEYWSCTACTRKYAYFVSGMKVPCLAMNPIDECGD